MSVDMNQEVKPEHSTSRNGGSREKACLLRRTANRQHSPGQLPGSHSQLGRGTGRVRQYLLYCRSARTYRYRLIPKNCIMNTRKLAALYLACGLDTRYCKLFVQSHVHEHAEMSWIMKCFTPMGWLNRMTQFKTKAGENPDSVSTGLYCYPVLMACDILLYQTNLVPVGDDQRQHIEFTRDLAQRFNSHVWTTGVHHSRGADSRSRRTYHVTG